MVFSAHPWFTTNALEEDQEDVSLSVRTIPLSVRMNWLKRLRHSKVQFLFSGSGSVSRAPKRSVGGGYDQDASPVSSSSSSSGTCPHEGPGSSSQEDDVPVMKASRLSDSKTYDLYASKHELNRRPFPVGLVIPPPPSISPSEGGEGVISIVGEVAQDIQIKESENDKENEGDSDDNDDAVEDKDDDDEWINQDLTYEGPVMIITAPIGHQIEQNDLKKQKCSISESSDPRNSLESAGIRIVKVYEQESVQDFYTLENIPKIITI
jgi:hypothetical protein